MGISWLLARLLDANDDTDTDAHIRFLPYLRRALQSLVRQYEPTYLYTSTSFSTTSSASTSSLTTREFGIAFYNLPLTSGIRDLRMDRIGELMSISGTVTRTSEVRPELVSGTFVCEGCKHTIRDVEQQFKYTEVGDFLLRGFALITGRPAYTLPEHDVQQPEWVAAEHRAVQVFGLAEGPHSGERE